MYVAPRTVLFRSPALSDGEPKQKVLAAESIGADGKVVVRLMPISSTVQANRAHDGVVFASRVGPCVTSPWSPVATRTEPLHLRHARETARLYLAEESARGATVAEEALAMSALTATEVRERQTRLQKALRKPICRTSIAWNSMFSTASNADDTELPTHRLYVELDMQPSLHLAMLRIHEIIVQAFNDTNVTCQRVDSRHGPFLLAAAVRWLSRRLSRNCAEVNSDTIVRTVAAVARVLVESRLRCRRAQSAAVEQADNAALDFLGRLEVDYDLHPSWRIKYVHYMQLHPVTCRDGLW